MITPEHLRIRDEENADDYLVRLWTHKDDYDIDKYTIASLMNAVTESSYDESKWRKDYAQYKKWSNYTLHKNLDQERLRIYEEKREEEEKERIRKQDQKREYRKMVRNSARFEKLQSDIHDAIIDLENVKPLTIHSRQKISTDNKKHGLALFSDWHYGAEVENNHNKYNKDVFRSRVRKLVDKIIDHGIKSKVSTLHVAQLGDLINGSIHVSSRVQANEDLIEQIKQASEAVAEVINELASIFPNIIYYNVIGNHARAGKKDEVGLKENYEYLIPWFLESRLRNLDNVTIVTDNDGYVEAKIFNEDVIFVHGNFDQADRAVSKMPQLLGYVPSYIFSGHVHHNYVKEHGKTTTIVNGSLMGVDDYATQGRFSSTPSQRFMVFDEKDSLECEYIIKLDKLN